MTLIAFACKGDSAEFIVDTACYLPNARTFRRTTKSVLLPHLNAAFLASGAGNFTFLARATVLAEAEDRDTFDDLLETAPQWLGRVWADVSTNGEPDMSCTSFLIGYSPRLGEFVAYEFDADTGFAPRRVMGAHVQPALWSIRPSPEEVAGTMKWLSKSEPEERVREFCDRWLKAPETEIPTPTSLSEWVTIALAVREQRSLQGPFARIYVAGQLLHTYLGVGTSSTMKVWDFDDEGEEFAKMVSYSDHPVSQLGPCPVCDSGEPFVDCCMRQAFDKPCACGSDATLGECCAITEDTPCDCGSGRVLRACCTIDPQIAANYSRH